MSSCCLHTLKTRMTAPVAFVYSYRYSYNFVLSSHCWFLRFPKRALNLSVTYACRRSVPARDIEYAVHPPSSQVALKLSRASKSSKYFANRGYLPCLFVSVSNTFGPSPWG